jgi:hypothetical protein
MVGEKSCAHQYKLKGSIVGGGVMDGNATVGDSHKGPLKTEGKPIYFRKKQNTNEFTNLKHAQYNHGPAVGAHGPSGPPE